MLLEFASKKKKGKKKSCDRGYPCSNTCISRKYNCKRPLKGQAKTYAGWLKKNAEGNKNWKAEAKKLTQHLKDGGTIIFKKENGRNIEVDYIRDKDINYLQVKDATKNRNIVNRPASERDLINYVNGLFDPKQRAVTGDGEPTVKVFDRPAYRDRGRTIPYDDYERRKKKASTISKNRTSQLTSSLVEGSFERDTKLRIAELLDKSKQEVIKNVGEEVNKAVVDIPTTMKQKGTGKTIINPEWRKLTDDLANDVIANQEKLAKGKVKQTVKDSKNTRKKLNKLV